MSRSRARNTATAPPLFPFLAVLLCTLGVLVMLLTAMASVQLDEARKKQHVIQLPAPELTPEQQQLRLQLEQLKQQWTLHHSRLAKAKEDEQLASGRLARVEQSLREQQVRLERLRRGIEELANLDRDHHTEIEEASQRLAKLQDRIADRQSEIEKRREEKSKEAKSYAILPYDGPNGTTRRPVYIECLEDRVVIQPEGIMLGPADFNLELGKGTPLAAALRAARDYYARNDTQSQEAAYPLILVRPEGVGSYLAVMATLEAWESDYGYEMVASDWQLDCGEPNPQLTQELQLAVANARTAAVAQAARAPIAFRRGSLSSFATAPGLLDSLQATPASANGIVDYDDLIATMASGKVQRRGIDTSRLAEALATAQASAEPNGTGTGGGGATGTGRGESGPHDGTAPQGITGLPPEEGEGRGLASQGESGGSQNGTVIPDGTAVAGAAPSDSGGQAGDAASAENPGAMASSGGAPAPPSSMSQTDQQPNPPAPTIVANRSEIAPHTAEAAGATPHAGSQAKGKGLVVERPVRVELKADRIVVGRSTTATGPSGRHAGRTVMLDKGPQETSEAFSTAVREHIADWGIAGSDSQWKPVLVLYVEPGSEALASQLATALKDSGVEVRLPDTRRR